MTSTTPIPSGYEHLEPYLRNFSAEHPSYDTNVFIIMRFIETPPMTRIFNAVSEGLINMGLNPVRADQRTFHPELWSNICTYMLGCSKAVVIFEDVEIRDFNPNVALELGFMLAHNKPTLILKEKRLPNPPTDIIGRLWSAFDSHSPEETIPEQIDRWLIDINWNPPPKAIPESVARFILREASAFHRVLETLNQEFNLEFEFGPDAAEMFRILVNRVAERGPIFYRPQSFLTDLGIENPQFTTLVGKLETVADHYRKFVIEPMNKRSFESTKESSEAIEAAHSEVKRVLEEVTEVIQDIRKSSGDLSE